MRKLLKQHGNTIGKCIMAISGGFLFGFGIDIGKFAVGITGITLIAVAIVLACAGLKDM